jgi:hypothetical protein
VLMACDLGGFLDSVQNTEEGGVSAIVFNELQQYWKRFQPRFIILENVFAFFLLCPLTQCDYLFLHWVQM